MKFNSLIPELSVTDIEKTRHFYCDVLGFKIEYERPEKKFIFVPYEGNQFMLEQINGYWNTGKLEYPFGRGINFEIGVSDVEAVYNRVKAAGIKVFADMETSCYREGNNEIIQKEFLIQDPDGYLLRFAQ